MTKVCHMTSVHNQEDNRIFWKECISLEKVGYEVFLVQIGDTYDKRGVHIIGVGDLPCSRLKRITKGAKIVYEKAAELDCEIYHFHDPELLPYGMKLKKAGKKVIFDSHERYTYQLRKKPYLPSWVTVPMAKIYGCYERYVLSKIDAVIFPCTMDGKNPFEGFCKRVSIISNAPLLEEFYDRYRPKMEKKRGQLCYVGGLTEDRGITNILVAAARAGASLVLAGDFSPKEYHDCLKLMPEFSSVDYRGRLNRREVADLIAQSNIGLCTLLDCGQYLHLDTFGVKVFEYMSMGIPVILSNSKYNCRMVSKYQFGICVNPENIEEIAHAMRFLLDNPAKAFEMGQNGRKAIRDSFNWNIEEEKLLRLYKDLLE